MVKKCLMALALIGLFVCSGMASAQSLDDLTLVTEQYPPYNFEEDGKLQGISVDLLMAALDEAGSNLTKSDIRLLPWAKGFEMAQNKQGTVLFATTRTEERDDLFQWVGPITSTKISLMARKDSNIQIDSLDDIDSKGYTIGVVRDDVGEHLLQDGGVPKANIDSVAKAVLNIKKMERDRIDAWAYEENVALWMIRSNGFEPDNYEPVYELKKGKLYYAFHKDTPDSKVNALQKAVDKVKASDKYEQILNKYQ